MFWLRETLRVSVQILKHVVEDEDNLVYLNKSSFIMEG